MNYDSLEFLGSRLDRIERENRFLKKAFVGLLIVASSIFLMGQARTSRTAEADTFLLKDNAGRVRARLAIESGDRPTLTFLNEKGSIVASLAGGDEPFLNLSRSESGDEVLLEASKQIVGLGIYDKTIRAGLALQNGIPALDLFDANGRHGAHLNWTAVDGPELSLFGPTDDSLAMLSAGAAGPSLTITDKDGFSAVLGSADLVTPRTGNKEHTSAASLRLFGKDKKTLWSAP